jgi:uncharacterized protein YecE (DUF72 family)
MLPRRRRYAFEFRHASWYEAPILDLLRDHNAALCISDHYEAPAPWEATADFVYVRGHGPGGAYEDNYTDAQLRRYMREIRTWRRARAVYVYFDNDYKGAAPADARRLMRMLKK